MKNISSANPAFREGDEVVLALGSYQGTLSVFLRLRTPTGRTSASATATSEVTQPSGWLAPPAPPPVT